MDIYEKVLEDHHNIREAIDELEATDNSQIEKRNRLLKNVEHLFVSHTNSEEQTLYLALADSPDKEIRDQVKKSRKEHDVGAEKLDALKETPLDSDSFLPRLEEFKLVVIAHFDEEEDELFEMARDGFSKHEADLIEEEMEELEDEVWTRPLY